MKLYEIVGLKENASAGSTGTGSIATVAAPLGAIQRRIPQDSMFSGKYTTDANLTPNTPDWMKKFKRKK
jgi:hypothetical protein